MVAVAVIGGVTSAVGSIASGSIASSGAQKAAQTEANASQAATAASEAMFNTAQATEAPYVTQGYNAETELADELGTGGGPPNYGTYGQLAAAPSLTDMSQLPGYSFTLQQGENATANAAAAQGLGVSGVALKGASSYAENLANTYYNNYLSNYWANQNNRYNMLYNLVNTGQAAAGQTATAATTAGGQQANAITQTAAGQAAAQQSAANLQAGGILGAGTGINNALLANALLGQTQGGSTLQPTGYSGLNAAQANAVNSQGYYFQPGATIGTG